MVPPLAAGLVLGAFGLLAPPLSLDFRRCRWRRHAVEIFRRVRRLLLREELRTQAVNGFQWKYPQMLQTSPTPLAMAQSTGGL